MYYNYLNLLLYNAVFNFIIGSRGCGKSFGAKKLVINKFIKLKYQFIYVRRYKTELSKIRTFFDDVSYLFPDHTFQVKGKTFYIDGEVAGWAIPLSTSQIEKSNLYKGVKYILFDEFLIDNQNSAYRYLKDEYATFANFYLTVDRDRDFAVCVFIGNAISMLNPYFNELGLKPGNDIRIIKKRDSNGKMRTLAALEVFLDPEQVESARNTRFGLLTADTEIDAFMHDNVFYLDDDLLIMDVPLNSKRYDVFFNIAFEGKVYTFIIIKRTLVLLFCDYVPNAYEINCIQQREITLTYQYMTDSIRAVLKSTIKRYLSLGLLGFSSPKNREIYFKLAKALAIK